MFKHVVWPKSKKTGATDCIGTIENRSLCCSTNRCFDVIDGGGRKLYLDFLRIIAILMVIYNHTNERGFYRFLDSKFPFVWSTLAAILCKNGVPIFFMITGALLIKKEETLKKTLMRIPKILIDLILFSVIYFWIDSTINGSNFSFIEVMSKIIRENYWHLWYLYAYIALIITLPFLRELVKGLTGYSLLYMFILSTVLMVFIPIFEYFFIAINVSLKPTWIINNIFIYPILGYGIHYILDITKIRRKHLALMWFITIGEFIISVICEYYLLIKEPGNGTELFLANSCLISATTIFLTIKCYCQKITVSNNWYKGITETGKCTFGIYLLHILFLWKIPFLNNIWNEIETISTIGEHIGVFITCILVFVICGICTYILRKIPIIHLLF